MTKKIKRRNGLKMLICGVLAITMILDSGLPAMAAKDIGRAKAKSIALSDAGVSGSKAKSIKVETDTDDGVKYYEIEFKTTTRKYEYEIKASNGKIHEKHSKKIKNKKLIGKKKAKKIALKDAGLKSSQVTFTKVQLDTDDGVKVYEIEFRKGTDEYEYEIKAKNGKILDKDVDRD